MKPIYMAAMAALIAIPANGQRRQRGDPLAVWKHLAKSYDKDGDGKITLAEYGRGERPFKNLDKNGDNAISAADFERRGRRGSGRRGGRRMGLARTIDLFGSFLNTDGKPGLTKAEWQRVIDSLSPDTDGRIDPANLSRIPGKSGKGRMGRMVGGMLSRGFDADGDGEITVREMHGIFTILDKDGSGTLEQGKEVDMPPGAGEMAPDFTLPFANDKSKAVTLSSFRGKKPVGLIFGSYT